MRCLRCKKLVIKTMYIWGAVTGMWHLLMSNSTQKSHGCCSPAGAALPSWHSTQETAVSAHFVQVLGVEVCQWLTSQGTRLGWQVPLSATTWSQEHLAGPYQTLCTCERFWLFAVISAAWVPVEAPLCVAVPVQHQLKLLRGEHECYNSPGPINQPGCYK